MDEGDDTTRKVAPGGGAGIKFEPISTAQFTSPQFTSGSAGFDITSFQSTQSALPQKAGMYGASVGPQHSHQPFRWRLAHIPTLPEFHPLERTAVFVENSSPSEVSTRISLVLRQRSIEASYDDEKAKVRCLSSSGVDFRVRLYRGRGNYSHGIIVEVQRRFGYAIDFHEDTKAILDTSQGLPTAPPPPNANYLPLVSDTEDNYVPPPSSGASSLKMVSKMFGHSGHDSYYLALQTLISLTDAAKMGEATARCVSTELFKPDNEVGEKLIDLIVSKKKEDDMFHLHVMAMTILANSLFAVEGNIPDMVREELRPTLLKELEQANASNLLAAQYAARCLEFLWRGDHDVGQLQAALETARGVGQARHSGLEQQAKRTLSRIHN